MKKNIEEFDFGVWWAKIIVSAYELKHFISYIDDKGCIYTHLKNNKSVQTFDTSSGGIIDADDQTIKRMSEALHKDFNSIMVNHLNYVVVFQFAILEQILEQSVELFLMKNNDLLKRVEQINQDFQIKNILSLDILKMNEFSNEIIKMICNKASKYIVSGKIEKSFKRIDKLIGLKYDQEIIEFIQELQNKRNKIVHETSFANIEIDFLIEVVDIYQKVLMGLEKHFIKNKIEFKRPFTWDNVA